MIFSSVLFIVFFLPVFLLLLEIIPRRLTNYYVLFSSLLFYFWGAPVFLFALIGLSAGNFILVRMMNKLLQHKKWLLIIGLLLNLGALFYFKYFNFFVDSAMTISGWFGFVQHYEALTILLPLGISFFIFESLTYIIDVYRNEQEPLGSFFHYLLYISFFPKLIAGPIVRYKAVAHQLLPNIQRPEASVKLQGLFIFFIGLAKKVFIANSLASVADRLSNVSPQLQDTSSIWIALIAFTFQIYFDFSGYSDMAIGISKIIGVELEHNFNNPYTANTVTDFWRRWHISMTNWFRNYLYIPLGGSRSGTTFTYRNLIIVFLLSGLWHGASWNFIVWGAWHGLWLLLERVALKKIANKMRYLYWPFTFAIISFGWLVFKVKNTSDLLSLVQQMFGCGDYLTPVSVRYVEYSPSFVITLIAAILFSFAAFIPRVVKMQEKLYQHKPSPRVFTLYAGCSLILFVLCLGFITGGNFNPFIYFRF
jgi:alginate O-acetyltransferase complex protein AlgI